MPIDGFSYLMPLIGIALLAICARLVWRSFPAPLRERRDQIFTLWLCVGLFLAYSFSMRDYVYSADWRIVGVPMPVILLERTLNQDGSVFWKDWIGGVSLLVGFVGNVLFWTLLPALPLAIAIRILRLGQVSGKA